MFVFFSFVITLTRTRISISAFTVQHWGLGGVKHAVVRVQLGVTGS